MLRHDPRDGAVKHAQLRLTVPDYMVKNRMCLWTIRYVAFIVHIGDTGERVIVATVLQVVAIQSAPYPQDS